MTPEHWHLLEGHRPVRLYRVPEPVRVQGVGQLAVPLDLHRPAHARVVAAQTAWLGLSRARRHFHLSDRPDSVIQSRHGETPTKHFSRMKCAMVGHTTRLHASSTSRSATSGISEDGPEAHLPSVGPTRSRWIELAVFVTLAAYLARARVRDRRSTAALVRRAHDSSYVSAPDVASLADARGRDGLESSPSPSHGSCRDAFSGFRTSGVAGTVDCRLWAHGGLSIRDHAQARWPGGRLCGLAVAVHDACLLVRLRGPTVRPHDGL